MSKEQATTCTSSESASPWARKSAKEVLVVFSEVLGCCWPFAAGVGVGSAPFAAVVA